MCFIADWTRLALLTLSHLSSYSLGFNLNRYLLFFHLPAIPLVPFPPCPRCCECGCILSHWYYERDGQLYCKKHYWARYGEHCHGCKETITKGLIMVTQKLYQNFFTLIKTPILMMCYLDYAITLGGKHFALCFISSFTSFGLCGPLTVLYMHVDYIKETPSVLVIWF